MLTIIVGHDPTSVSKYYELVLWIMRVVSCCIISKGPQNAHTIGMGREFLHENRHVAINVFKRHANIGQKSTMGGGELRELTQIFILLMCLTEYTEVSFLLGKRTYRNEANLANNLCTMSLVSGSSRSMAELGYVQVDGIL